MQNQRVDRIMTADPVTIEPGDSLEVARGLLESGSIHHIPVLDNNNLVGILSSSDFFKLALLADGDNLPKKLMVKHLMKRNPTTLPTNASLRDAAEAFRGGNFHALPVVDGESLVGILTTTDLVEALLQHLPRGDGSIRVQNAGAEDSAGNAAQLKAVCDAAEHYIRSGHAEHEHSILVRRLDELRGASQRIL